jgi:hypothetical protein
MVDDPLGRFTTWWGVGFNVWHHGKTGIGTSRIPAMQSDVAAFGIGDVSNQGGFVATGVPVHVMTAGPGDLPGSATLELDVGDPQIGPIPGVPNGHLRVLWASYSGTKSNGFNAWRYAWGAVGLVTLIAGALWLASGALRSEI